MVKQIVNVTLDAQVAHLRSSSLVNGDLQFGASALVTFKLWFTFELTA